MKVSYLWLSEYVDLSGYTAKDLAEKLTNSGIEVDIIHKRNQGVEQVVVGYVKAREKHPDADRLSVCTVDAGTGEDLQIVCGAKNVEAGQKVPVALPGAKLPGDVRIQKTKLRGVESQGMICSAKELGLNDKLLPKELQEGILVLPEDLPAGADIREVLALDDEVLELDLTPNRSDCLSMIGVAYEIAALIGRPVKLPDTNEGWAPSGGNIHDRVRLKISAEECEYYTLRLMENVRIGPSPLWMQNRLMAAGIRPINNVVDITNYVMLEYGQPLHAFDFDALSGGFIDVRLAKPGEKIVTLDDVERTLDEGMLLITDGTKPVGIAGVMGGANSEVTSQTKTILLESAKFSAVSVRKTSRKLGLRSEASLRFEREVDPLRVVPALNRAAQLMALYAGARVVDGIVEGKTKSYQPAEISIRLDGVNRFLGTDLTKDEVESIFKRLDFRFEPEGEQSWKVHVPSRRLDITRPVDLYEEIARLYGYDRIPTTLMTGVTTTGALTKQQKIRRELRRLLTDMGLHEAIGYTFTHPGQKERFPGLYSEAKPIRLFMPMSEERSVLRTSLIPHLLDAAVYNRNRGTEDVALFELGTVFVTQEETLKDLPEEKTHLAVLLTGKRKGRHWAEKSDSVDFYDLKGVFEQCCEYLGLHGVEYVPDKPKGFHPARTAAIYLSSGKGKQRIGWLGQLHPDLAREYDLKDTYVLEIDLEPVYESADFSVRYRSLPRYPSVSRDIAVILDKDLQVREVVEQIRKTAGSLLESVEIFDVYTDERMGADKKSVAFALVFRHPERTLTDEEVGKLHEQVIADLEKTFGARLR